MLSYFSQTFIIYLGWSIPSPKFENVGQLESKIEDEQNDYKQQYLM